MKRKLFFMMVSIFVTGLLFGQENSSTVSPEIEKTIKKEINYMDRSPLFIPKDPLVAGLFSITCPGLGQIYCQRPMRGVTYFASEMGCFILASALAGTKNVEYTWTATDENGEEKELTTTETINKWDELSGLERAGVVGLIMGGVGIHIWNIMDAYHLAQDHNQRLSWLGNVDLQLGFKNDNPGLKLETSKTF
ncbi:MAG: hypothetical protein PHX21_12565 [bacterium]|nr:hypothetical protein [bacterium]